MDPTISNENKDEKGLLKILGPNTQLFVVLAVLVLALLIFWLVFSGLDISREPERTIPDDVFKALTDVNTAPQDAPKDVLKALNNKSKAPQEIPEEVLQAL